MRKESATCATNGEYNRHLHPWMALTLTHSKQDDLKKMIERDIKLFGPSLDKACVDWEAYPELTKSYNLHWHLVCHVRNYTVFWNFVRKWKHNVGFQTDVKVINHYKIGELEGWIDYIRKDWHPRSVENCLTPHVGKDGKEFFPMPTAHNFLPKEILRRMEGFDDYITKSRWRRLVGLVSKKTIVGQMKVRKTKPVMDKLDTGIYATPEYEKGFPKYLKALEF